MKDRLATTVMVCSVLSDLLFQVVEEFVVEKLPEGDLEPVTQLFDSHEPRVFTFLVEQTVHGGWRYPRVVGKGIDGDSFLGT